MLEIKVRPNEEIDIALKRFKNKVLASGVLEVAYIKRRFENTLEKKKRKQKALDKSYKFNRFNG